MFQFPRGVGGSCEFCDNAHALLCPASVEMFPAAFVRSVVGGGVSFQAAELGGDPLFFFLSFEELSGLLG